MSSEPSNASELQILRERGREIGRDSQSPMDHTHTHSSSHIHNKMNFCKKVIRNSVNFLVSR